MHNETKMLKIKTKATRAKNLYIQVVEEIKHAIFNEDILPGQSLPNETELSLQMDVSRPVIREALRVLQTQGFLEVRRGNRGGTYVTDLNGISISDNLEDLMKMGKVSVKDLIDARLLIEPEVCRLAAVKADPVQLDQLKIFLNKTAKATNNTARLESNMDFHRCIVTIANNPIYTRTTTIIMDFLENFIRSVKPADIYIHNDHDHVDIYDAISKKQPNLAFSLSKLHIEGMQDALILMETQWLQSIKK